MKKLLDLRPCTVYPCTYRHLRKKGKQMQEREMGVRGRRLVQALSDYAGVDAPDFNVDLGSDPRLCGFYTAPGVDYLVLTRSLSGAIMAGRTRRSNVERRVPCPKGRITLTSAASWVDARETIVHEFQHHLDALFGDAAGGRSLHSPAFYARLAAFEAEVAGVVA